MPLPGNPGGVGKALVVQRAGGTSASSGPSAGTSAAVNLDKASMHGAADFGLVSEGAAIDFELPPSRIRLALIRVVGKTILRSIGVLGLSVLYMDSNRRAEVTRSSRAELLPNRIHPAESLWWERGWAESQPQQRPRCKKSWPICRPSRGQPCRGRSLTAALRF